MKKILNWLIVLLFVISSTGCASRSDEGSKLKIASKMNEAMMQVLEEEASTYINMNKGYYSYYLPYHVGKRDSTSYSSILVSNNQEVLMSLNASTVIVDKYYYKSESANTVTTDEAIYSEVFTGKNNKGLTSKYSVNIFLIDNSYYLLIQSRYFKFLCTADVSLMPMIAQDIIRIARTTKVNQTAILADFSNKENINYQREKMSIFSQAVPENGTLAEMLEDYHPVYEFDTEEEEASGNTINWNNYLEEE